MKGFFSASQVQKEKPLGLVPRCGSCGLYQRCHTPKIQPQGEGRRKILIVGSSPSEQEDKTGRLFSGSAGELLYSKLGSLGVDLDEDVWVTNALICHSKHTPDAKQIQYCRPNLTNTLNALQPRTVITLGREALASVLSGVWSDVSSLDRWVGWNIPLKNYWVCPTYHPSFLLHSKNAVMDKMFTEHLKRACMRSLEALPPPPKGLDDIEILLDETKVFAALREIHRAGGWVAVDYETTSIKPEWTKAEIVSCAVSNGERTLSYPWVGKTIKATELLLMSPRVHKIASNLKMEERWTRKVFGRGVANWGWDTMLAAHCLDNRTGICSLKFQSLVQFGVPVYNKHIEPYLFSKTGHYNRIRDVELHQLLKYGGMDAILEYRLAMKQREQMGFDE